MESISRLRSVLISSLGPRGLQHGEQILFDELMAHKNCLRNVFDVGPSSLQERRDIESGNIVINNKSFAVNAEFARQVIFLAQQLDCSERYLTGLLHTIITQNPNTSPENWLELTVAEFHQRRRHLAESLRDIFEAAEASTLNESPPLYSRINAFARQELIAPIQDRHQVLTLARRIIQEVDNLDNVIARVQDAKQNAGSLSLNQGGTASLGSDILNARCESLKYERRTLAIVLCLIARIGCLASTEIQTIIDWLAIKSNHDMTYYFLTTVLHAFDPMDPNSLGGQARRRLVMDPQLVEFMSKKLDASAEWKEPGLKSVVLLRWTLFLTEARHHDPALDSRSGFKTEELAIQIWNAVQGDAFTYLTLVVLHLQTKRNDTATPSLLHLISPSSESETPREPLPEDMRMKVLHAFETLVRSLITHASSELRKIKQRQEDLVLANARSDRTRGFRTSSSSYPRHSSATAPETERPAPPPRNDIAILFSFIGILFSSLPDERALQFWGSRPHVDPSRMTHLESVEMTAGKLPAFLQWAVWSSQIGDLDILMSLYDMLSGLAKGQQCSELAYNFVARGAGEVISGAIHSSASSNYNSRPSVSWTMIFNLLESWATPVPNVRPTQMHTSANITASQHWQAPGLALSHGQLQTPTLAPKDVLLAQSFLRFLRTVVTHSTAVRIAVAGHAQFRAIPTLVSLIPLAIPLELKGSLFETLSGFCEPGAGVAGVEICKAVWTLMEKCEVINVRPGTDGAFGVASNILPSAKGVELELAEVEAIYKLYPATLPFLRLLGTLIHTPKRLLLRDRVAAVESINTIPDNLGQPYRLPGIGPFIAFVVDNVFMKIPNREYLQPSDRWQMNDLCLCFMERVLASYDLQSLVDSADVSSLKKEAVVPFLVHPGYDIMKRLLTNSGLQASILSYIVDGVEGFEKGLAQEEPFFHSTIVRVLRIVHRVLELQDIFLDVLIPLLAEFDAVPLVGTIHPRSYFTKLDQALSFGSQYAPAVATYVTYPAHAELVLLSIRIITTLSASPAFANLTTLIERSIDSERILNGFVGFLKSDSTMGVTAAEAIAEQHTGVGAPDVEISSDLLEQPIRLATLELLVQNTDRGRPYPNVAHFLLFGKTGGDQLIQDPHALGAQQNCIHVIIDILNIGVPALHGKRRKHDLRSQHLEPLYRTIPELAERCFRVIHQLCVHPRTSDPTMRYLRTHEDFFARQLAAVPFKAPETIDDPYIQVLYPDGFRVTTTVSALTSFLLVRSWIFDLVALELHVLTSKGHQKGVTELLDILSGVNDLNHGDMSEWEGGVLHPFRDFGQSHLRIIEFLQSMDFDWFDSLSVKPLDLQLLKSLDLRSCLRINADGCEIVDKNTLLSLLSTARRVIHSQTTSVAPPLLEQLNAETAYILESCAVENHRREVRHAAAIGYGAWRRLVDMTLTKSFNRLPPDRRENMLFELLQVLPDALHSTNVADDVAVLLSETLLCAITKLREDRRSRLIIQSIGADGEIASFPADRLYAILGSVSKCILDSNRVDLVRGNLYATLINYLHLASSRNGSQENNETTQVGSLSTSVSRQEYSFRESSSPSPTSLETGSFSILKSSLERLINVISRDAIDGDEVWKTVSFMLLDSLSRLSCVEKQHIVLSVLVQQGVLHNVVRDLKESDLRLQAILKPDPDELTPLYVYEAKMSMLIRIAQTRAGAERLLDVQLLPTLARCDFLDARPEADQSFMDQDTFLPSAIQRYHQLFMPALQLVNGILATLGQKHVSAANQVSDFLSSHKDTIAILLKSDPDVIPLALLEELHLLVSVCGRVLPFISKPDLLSTNSGFGAIHAAVLILAARYLADDSWIERVKPFDDTEAAEATAYTPVIGYGVQTKFDLHVRQQIRGLRHAVIMYLGTASEFTEPEITVVLSPVFAISRQEERGSRFIATIPTIGDAIETLHNFTEDLGKTLKLITDLAGEIASKNQLRVDHMSDLLELPDLPQDLDVGQKQAVICRELERRKRDATDVAHTLLRSTEMLLLLLWRHLLFFSEGDQTQLGLQKSQGMRFLHVPDSNEIRQEVDKKLAPALQRLKSLDLEGNGWRSGAAYLDVMSRRIRDTAGLHESPDFLLTE